MADAGPGAWNRAVFSADGRPLAVADVVVAAHARGDLQEVWSRLLRLVACEQRAATLVESGELAADDGTLQSMSEQFRYDRDLITAEETERWLEDRGLTLDDFDAHFLRHYWSDVLAEGVEPEAVDYRSATDDLLRLLLAELTLSGELDRLARALGWRIAAARARAEPSAPADVVEGEPRGDDGPDPDERPSPPGAEDEAMTLAWAARIGADPRWFVEFPSLEVAFEQERAKLLTGTRVAGALALRRLPLSRIALETIDVDTLDAAREIALCVSADGLSMADAASQGGYLFERTEVLFEDLAPEVQQQVLRAVPGEMLAAVPHEGGYHVHRLAGRTEPDPEDDAVRARVEQLLLDQHFSQLASRYVQWPMPVGGAS